MKLFIVNSKPSGLGTTLLKCWIIRISEFKMSDEQNFDFMNANFLYKL
jgi:hypothetical protein